MSDHDLPSYASPLQIDPPPEQDAEQDAGQDAGQDAKKTRLVLKTECLKLLRVRLSAGQSLPEHHAPGEITIQCVRGRVRLTAMGQHWELTAGTVVALPSKEIHAVEAIEDACLLVTIALVA